MQSLYKYVLLKIKHENQQNNQKETMMEVNIMQMTQLMLFISPRWHQESDRLSFQDGGSQGEYAVQVSLAFQFVPWL